MDRKYAVLRGKNTGKFVITIDASEYGPDTQGIQDSTEALQRAIDDCQAAGGGTVYLPAGRYALHGELVIRTSVMLHGEEAAEEDGNERKTILCCCYGRGDVQGVQIRMEACTGLIGVTLYHPEQNMEQPVPYPPTVRQQGSNSITVEDAVFVNPWIGVQCGPDANELHYIKNVRMSPLYQGIFMDMTTDIGRMQGVSISPVWYEKFLEGERENEKSGVKRLAETAAAYMFRHATGIYMARSDWEYGYDISIEGCRTGLLVTSGQDIGPNAQFYGLKITGCETGIRLHRGNPYGIAVTDSSISSGDQKMKAAIWCDDTFDSVLQCYGVEIEGAYEHLVCQEGNGQASFVECSFRGKAVSDGQAYGSALENAGVDVLQKAGGLSLLNAMFSPGGVHVGICEGAGGAQIVGCRAAGEEICLAVRSEAEEAVLYEKASLSIPKKKSGGHPPYPYPVEPKESRLYAVTRYGASGDGVADDTEAFEQALKQAESTGGYVYVPGGRYKVTRPLRVPKGVELRGTAETPCHTMGGGSVIMICCGHGQEDAAPFLSLEGGCGIRGIVLYYPEQDPVKPCAYPWTVQSLGDRCYAVDTVFVNAWKGIDFGSKKGKEHYISYVSGAPVCCGIFAGGNEGDIWIENVQYNPHYWYRCDLPGRPEGETWKAFWHNQIRYLDAFVYGENRALHVLNTFVFAARNGIRFIEQNNRGTKGTIIGHGTDGGECGIRIDSLERAEFVNTELVTIESPNRKIYLRNAGEGAAFYNTLMWGTPDTAVLVEKGDLKMIQTNVVDSGETAIVVENGKAEIAAAYFYRRQRQLLVKGGETRYLANMSAGEAGAAEKSLSPDEMEQTGGKVSARYNWHK